MYSQLPRDAKASIRIGQHVAAMRTAELKGGLMPPHVLVSLRTLEPM